MATKQKTLALLTIGQSPRVDLTGDVLSRLPDDIRIVEYGALDPYTLEEVTARFPQKRETKFWYPACATAARRNLPAGV